MLPGCDDSGKTEFQADMKHGEPEFCARHIMHMRDMHIIPIIMLLRPKDLRISVRSFQRLWRL